MKSFLLVLAGSFAFAPVALAALPPAPTITVAATDIKQLQFDISPVTRANWYELWFKANPGAPWVEFTRTRVQRPRIRINTSVHLLDWRQARYYVKACNPSGCSQSNEVGVNGEQLAAIGYFKPQTPAADQLYGGGFALSEDGKTLAAVGMETVNGVQHVATIHVYRKTTATSGWRHESRIVPSTVQPDLYGDDRLAISFDGSLIAFGNPDEDHDLVAGAPDTGAVYLFRHVSTGWKQTQKIAGENFFNDMFGVEVRLDGPGTTLVVGHNTSGGLARPGTLEVYRDLDDGNDQFVHADTLPIPPLGDWPFNSCKGMDVSDMGHIVRVCGNFPQPNFVQVFLPTAPSSLQYTETARIEESRGEAVVIDSLGDRLIVQEGDEGIAFRHVATGWVSDGYLTFFSGAPDERRHMALSSDGKIAAIGSRNDNFVGRGPLYPPYQSSDQMTGSVSVFERLASGWTLRRIVKADSTNLQLFGFTVDLADRGRVLAVGAPGDRSKATGIDGNRNDASVQGRGAIWLY